MKDRNVEVEIITARNRDQPCYKGFLNSYLFSHLHSHGAKVYEEPYKYLHMKSIEIDHGKSMTIGSFNQDHWSFYCNNEANLVLKNNSPNSYKANQQFIEIFNRLKQECRPVDFNESYSIGGYIENQFWKIVLGASYALGNNRDKK